MPLFKFRTVVREGSARVIKALDAFNSLRYNQPLLLEPEPGNKKDPSAVKVKTVLGVPVGYIAREHAPIIASKIAAGAMLMAMAKGTLDDKKVVLIWEEPGTITIDDYYTQAIIEDARDAVDRVNA